MPSLELLAQVGNEYPKSLEYLGVYCPIVVEGDVDILWFGSLDYGFGGKDGRSRALVGALLLADGGKHTRSHDGVC